MDTLFVIGNGFDIAHGINSRYSDFYNYLNGYEKTPIPLMPECPRYVLADSISVEDDARHALLKRLEKYIPKEDLWSSFEEALGYLDYEQLEDDNSCYLLDPGDDNWRDSANHDYQYMIQQELDFTKDIDYQFKRWISSLNTNIACISSVINFLEGCNGTRIGFLNFNYTDTLERAYNIPRNHILYIHGKAAEQSTLILGHHNNSILKAYETDTSTMTEEEYQNYIEFMQDQDFRIQEAKQVIKGYFQTTYKNTKSIIMKNKGFFENLDSCKQIYILGHSLSDIDMEYFEEIRKNIREDCCWTISYYSRNDYEKISQFTMYLNIANPRIIKLW